MADWFYQIMGKEFGPLSTTKLIDAVVEGSVSPDTEVRKSDGTKWTPALSVKGLFEAVDKRRAELEEEGVHIMVAEAELAAKERARWENLKVSTCGPLPGKEFQVVDTIFAMDSSGEVGFFSKTDADPNEAFSKVKMQLRHRAYELGADAVVSCQFEYRVAVSTNEGVAAIASLAGVSAGHSQCIEIFTYGTAIKYTSD